MGGGLLLVLKPPPGPCKFSEGQERARCSPDAGPMGSPLLIVFLGHRQGQSWQGFRWFLALLMGDPIQVPSGLKWQLPSHSGRLSPVPAEHGKGWTQPRPWMPSEGLEAMLLGVRLLKGFISSPHSGFVLDSITGAGTPTVCLALAGYCE